MKRVIEYNGRKIKFYLCNRCLAETTSLFCFLLNPSGPNTEENWVELCSECYKEEVKGE